LRARIWGAKSGNNKAAIFKAGTRGALQYIAAFVAQCSK